MNSLATMRAECDGPRIEHSTKQKLARNIFEVCKQYQVPESYVQSAVESIDLSDCDSFTLARIQSNLPKILNALIGKKQNGQESGLQSLDLQDLRLALPVLVDAIKEQKTLENDVVISIGMGGSENLPSARTPAYIASALRSLQKFSTLNEEGIHIGYPTVRVFKANHISVVTNGFSQEKVSEVSEATFDFFKAFIQEFFPQFLSCFVFESDNEWIAKPGENMSFIEQEIRKLSNILKNIDSIRDDIEALMMMGRKHGGDQGVENAFLYAAVHPFYNQSLLADGSAGISEYLKQSQPSLIIDYGGRPQERFNRMARALIESPEVYHLAKTPIIHAITKAGKVPVYYQARDGDYYLGENFDDIDCSLIDRQVRGDYKELFDLVGEDAYKNFITTFNTKYI